MLQILDRYRIQLPVKGGFVWRACSTIIITTNIHPRNWYEYNGREGQYEALRRRIHEVWYFGSDKYGKVSQESFWEDWNEISRDDSLLPSGHWVQGSYAESLQDPVDSV